MIQHAERLEQIIRHLMSGGKVMVLTAYKGTVYTAKHLSMFKATNSGLFVQRGKNWDCLNFTPIKFSKEAA